MNDGIEPASSDAAGAVAPNNAAAIRQRITAARFIQPVCQARQPDIDAVVIDREGDDDQVAGFVARTKADMNLPSAAAKSSMSIP